MAKYVVGQPVELNTSRFQGEDFEYYPFKFKYKEADKGRVTQVYETIVDIPVDLFNELTNTGESFPAGTFYNVQVGLHEILLIPQRDLDGINNLEAKVEERIAKAQENKEFKDVGERVGGTKKEKMAYKMVLLTDLSEIELNPQLAIELVKKDKVYPKVDVLKLQERGVSSGAAFLIVKIREAYPPKPEKNNPLYRKIYTGFAEYLNTAFDKVVTIKDFKEKTAAISNVLNKVVEIVSPEKLEYIEDERDIMAQSKESAEAKRNVIEAKQSVLLSEFKDLMFRIGTYTDKEISDYKVLNDLLNSEYNGAEMYRKLNDELRQVKFDIQKFSAPYTVSEGALLETIYEKSLSFYSRASMQGDLLKTLFGKSFYNLIFDIQDTAHELYRKAFLYTALSEEESQKLTFEKTESYKIQLKTVTERLEFVNSHPTKEKLTEFFDVNAAYCFGGLSFEILDPNKRKKKTYCWDDVKQSMPMIEQYVLRYIPQYERAIADAEANIKRVTEYFKQREDDWSWAFEKKNVQNKERAELKANTGKPLAYIKRIGGLKVDEDNVTVEFLTNTMGYKSVTLGNYVKDNESREHIRHFIGAIVDLFDVLNFDIIQINKIRGLSMWFGAGGGGKAGAYYRSNGVVINLTKTNGDGAVAHEMAHYLDDCLSFIGNPSYVTDKSYASIIRSGRYYVKNIKNPRVWEAMKNIYEYIHERRSPYLVFDDKPFGASQIENQISKDPESGKIKIKVMVKANDKKTYDLAKWGMLKDTIEETIERIKSYYGNQIKYFENFSGNAKSVIGYVIHKFGHKEYEMEFETRSSAYYANSLAMSSDYWTRDWELFARAFETYMFDKLEKAGRCNNYLVSGDYFDRPEGVYPSGAEREDLYVLYDNLFYWIKREYQIKDFVPFTLERTKEFIELKNTAKEEVVTEEVIVPDERKLTIDEKFMKLIAMIKSSNKKMEQGGDVTFYAVDEKGKDELWLEMKDGGSVDINDLPILPKEELIGKKYKDVIPKPFNRRTPFIWRKALESYYNAIDRLKNKEYKRVNEQTSDKRVVDYYFARLDKVKYLASMRCDNTGTIIDVNTDNFKFDEGGEILLAPNGKPSNLTPEQHKLVRTPAFKKWFGDWENSPETASKVLDGNGEPMVMYRGQPDTFEEHGGIFNYGKKFMLSKKKTNYFGFFFTTSKFAAEDYGYGGYVLECFLNVRNLADITALSPSVPENIFNKKLIELGLNKKDIPKGSPKFNQVWSLFDKGGEKLRLNFMWSGYNGVSFIDDSARYEKAIVVFLSNQIKLADGTNTDFDPENPDVRYKDGGEVPPIKNTKNTLFDEYGDELYNISLSVFLALDKERKELLVLNELNRSKIHNFIDTPTSPITNLVKVIIETIKVYSKYSRTEPLPIFDEDLFVCFYPEQKNINSIGLMPAYINYFGHLLSNSMEDKYKSRYYSESRYRTIKNWVLIFNAPDKKYLQCYGGKPNIIFTKNLYDKKGHSFAVLTLELISDNLLRIHNVIPTKRADTIKKREVKEINWSLKTFVDSNGKEKNADQLLRLRSFKYLHTLIASSGMSSIGKEDAFNSNTETKIQQTSESANNFEEKKITQENFHKNTFADFVKISSTPSREPDFTSDYNSQYWHVDGFVIRKSDHWGQLDTCTWLLDSSSHKGIAIGTCKLSDFREIFKEGGDISVTSASSRFRPYETITFEKPIIGLNGAKLLSYTWAYEWTEDWDNFKGETISKRISDWNNAELSADTGRNIVHQFTVELPDGEKKTVSSESVLILLGYTEREKTKSFSSLVTALKTLAKQKMQLAIMEAKQKEYQEVMKELVAAEKPQIVEGKYETFGKTNGGVTVYSMGEATVWQHDKTTWDEAQHKSVTSKLPNIEPERKEALIDGWIRRELEKSGVSSQSGLYDLKNRITRQERKVAQLTI